MKIKVTTPNRMLIIKNIPVRTPVEIDIRNKAELAYMESYLRTECADFEIIEDIKPSNNPELVVEDVSIKSPPAETTEEISSEDSMFEETLIESPILDEPVKATEEPVVEELGDSIESNRILDKVLTD